MALDRDAGKGGADGGILQIVIDAGELGDRLPLLGPGAGQHAARLRHLLAQILELALGESGRAPQPLLALIGLFGAAQLCLGHRDPGARDLERGERVLPPDLDKIGVDAHQNLARLDPVADPERGLGHHAGGAGGDLALGRRHHLAEHRRGLDDFGDLGARGQHRSGLILCGGAARSEHGKGERQKRREPGAPAGVEWDAPCHVAMLLS